MISAQKNRFLSKIIFCTLFMGSSFPSVKYLIAFEHIPPFLLGASRFMLAGVLMLFFSALKTPPKNLIPSKNGSILKGMLLVSAVGLLQTTGTMGLLNLSLETITASMASVILFTNPLWLALLAHFFLSERLNRTRLFCLALGVIGVIICMGINRNNGLAGLSYAFFGSLCWACCTLLIKKVPYSGSAWLLTAWQLLLGGFIMLIISYFSHENYQAINITPFGILWFLWLVLPASIGSFSLWFSALEMGGATLTSCFLFLVPLFSTLISTIALHDKLTFQSVLGGGLILVSLFLINRKNK